MSSNLTVPGALAVAHPDLTGFSSAELRAELVRGLTMTAEGLARMSLVWQELERRGDDLSDLRRGITEYLPAIAAGRLAGEAVVAFAGRPTVLRALDGVPLPEQRRLAGGGTLRVIDTANPEDEVDVPVNAIPSAALKMVFSAGVVRSPHLQRLSLRTAPRAKKTVDRERSYQPRYDAGRGVVMVGKMAVAVGDLLKELASAAGPDHPPPADLPNEVQVVKVKLHPDECERFRAACRRAALPESEMARKALRAFGLI